ncbi:MAG: alginate lyase family protein, partial [bacterium]|nr:alginate lyase family protein [bacterium]
MEQPMDLSLFRDDRILTEWPLVDAEHEARIDLPMDIGDWTCANELRADIYLPPGVDGQITCTLSSGHRSEAMSEDDGYRFNAIVSPRGGNIWEDWQEFRFPAECFYTLGLPTQGWGDTTSGNITLPQGGRIRNIRLLERDIVQGPRMTDEALINTLNLDHPGLEATKQVTSTEETLREIARYFRTSTFDRRHVEREEPPKANLEEADRILAGHMMGHHWPNGVDWDANPYGYIEWSIRIHGFPYFTPLENAWEETQNPKYAKGVETILQDWMARTPMPYGVRSGGLAWGHSLIVSQRAYCTLVDAFTTLADCPEVEDRTLIDLLKSIYEHVVYLLKFESFPPSNKTISEGRSMLAMACSFPEFREANAWYEAASQRLLDDMNIQVMSDGASYELTPGYQMAIASWFLNAYRVAQKFGRTLDPELEAGIRRMYDWCVSITRPDFSRPSISDAGSTDSKYGGAIAGPGRILNDPAALWAGTEGKEGTHPDYTSIARQDSGYFAMRSSWDRNAAYLLFEGGPFGRFHQHEDMLSFDLHAGGIPFIVDPGITSYFPNDWTSFYRTTQAHNTVLVDGCGQNRRTQTIDQWVEPARDKTTWRSNERSDVAVATYDAPYAGLDASIQHQRSIMFIKPNYFLLFDELIGEGKHTYEALFHFMPYRLLLDPETKAVRTGRMSPPNLEVLPLIKMTPRITCGQNDPVQGWLALGGQDVPAPVAIYKKTAQLPFRTGYVLAPFTDGVTAGITTKTTRRGDLWTVRVLHA